MFLGFGFLLCTQCSSKHCMIYQRLETACRLLQVSTEASNLHKRFGSSLLMLDGIVSVCMSEIISTNKEAAVKSRLAAWKRHWPHTLLPGFHSLVLFLVL